MKNRVNIAKGLECEITVKVLILIAHVTTKTFKHFSRDSTGVWSHGKFGIYSIVNCCGNTLRQPKELEKIKVFINDNVGKKRGV